MPAAVDRQKDPKTKLAQDLLGDFAAGGAAKQAADAIKDAPAGWLRGRARDSLKAVDISAPPSAARPAAMCALTLHAQPGDSGAVRPHGMKGRQHHKNWQLTPAYFYELST
jgi:hypothetical protein